jgi:regulator of protease activity HflC (stomatin/prohibitin superfamily)
MFETIVLILLALIALFALTSSVKIIQPYERGLVTRLGRYHSTAEPGVSILVPFIDSMIRVDMREQVINVLPQSVITEDNVVVTVDAVIYYKIVDPVKAEFEIENFSIAATTLAQTNLRNIIGETQLDETLTARDQINTTLRGILDEATNPWGVKVTKVELQKIEPPTDITEAMSKQMKAEREKRANILEAQGLREAAILKAEGEAKATRLKAAAEAEAVQVVAEAAEQYFTERAFKLKQLEVSGDVLANSGTKFVLPTDGELVNVLNLDGKQDVVPVRKQG